MKVLVKVLSGIIIALWVLVVAGVVVFLCKEMNWSIMVAEWLGGLFGVKSAETFFDLFGRFLFYFGIGLGIFTLIFIVGRVSLTDEDESPVDIEIDTDKRELKLKLKKEKQLQLKLKKEKKAKKKEAVIAEVSVDEQPVVQASSTAVNDFLNKLRK